MHRIFGMACFFRIFCPGHSNVDGGFRRWNTSIFPGHSDWVTQAARRQERGTLLTSCVSSKKQKPTLYQGWVGLCHISFQGGVDCKRNRLDVKAIKSDLFSQSFFSLNFLQ